MKKGGGYMSRKGFINKLVSAALCVLIGTLGCAGYAAAEETREQQGSLQMTCRHVQENIEGVSFQIYQIASTEDASKYTVTKDFTEYQVDFTELANDEWYDLASTLAAYTARDHLTPTQQKSTGKDGIVSFENLDLGIYLVTGDTYTWNSKIYRMNPFLVAVPQREESGHLRYEAVAELKYEEIPEEKENYHVIKIWSDSGREYLRPENVTIQLLCDGEIYDTVVLNKGNNWRHDWQNLPSEKVWQVTETGIPSGYTVTCVQDGTTFAVTNRYRSPGGGNHGGGGGGGSTPPGSPDVPSTSIIVEDPGVPLAQFTEPETPAASLILPQTGMLWWPVPVLSFSGMLFFMYGWLRRKKNEES